MSYDVELPKGTEILRFEAADDGMYVTFDFMDKNWRLLESRTVAEGPEADSE